MNKIWKRFKLRHMEQEKNLYVTNLGITGFSQLEMMGVFANCDLSIFSLEREMDLIKDSYFELEIATRKKFDQHHYSDDAYFVFSISENFLKHFKTDDVQTALRSWLAMSWSERRQIFNLIMVDYNNIMAIKVENQKIHEKIRLLESEIADLEKKLV